ncbi:MAG: hypothetical protein R6V06_08510 [Kiritimatiellia bacterium]
MKKSILCLIAALFSCWSFAADNVFTGTGNWTDTSRWSLSHIPSVDEMAWIQGTAAMDSSQNPGGMNVQGTLDITGVSSIFSTTGQVYVGYSGTEGVLTQTDGSFETAGNFYVGEYETGSVNFTDTDVVIGKFILGHGAIGRYDQQGGTLLCNGTHVVLGHMGAGKGIMSITDTSMTSIPKIMVGLSTGGEFYATNSVIDCSNFSIAIQNYTEGYVELIESAITDCENFSIGNDVGAKGSVYTSQSNITSQYVRVGFGANGIGSLIMDNTLLKATDEITTGYNGFGCVSNRNGIIETGQLFAGNIAGAQGSLYSENSDTDVNNIYAGYEANSTGVITFASGTVNSSSAIISGYEGVGSMSNIAATVETPNFYVSYNSGTSEGYMYCGADSTTTVARVMQIGRYGTGLVDCYGHLSVTNPAEYGLFLGNFPNASGTLNVYDGADVSVDYDLILGYQEGAGIVNQYGGDVYIGRQCHAGGHSAPGTGQYNLSGGKLTVEDIFYVGKNGTGELTVSGGEALLLESTFGLTVSLYAGSTGTVYLTGGILGVGRMRDYQGYGSFFFDGGVLKALSSSTSFMTGLDVAEVREGGAVIDTAGENITIAQSIAHDSRSSEPAKDGGLTKTGEGTLIMTGTLGFTGDLGADGGTLNLSSATYSLTSGSGLWGSGTLIPPAGSMTVSSASFVAPGSTNGVGTLTVDGDLTVEGELRMNISDDGTTCGTLGMGSNQLNFNAGSELVIANPEKLNEDVSYTIVTGSDISGLPDVTGLPDNWTVSTTQSNTIRIIYNSGTLILVR